MVNFFYSRVLPKSMMFVVHLNLWNILLNCIYIFLAFRKLWELSNSKLCLIIKLNKGSLQLDFYLSGFKMTEALHEKKYYVGQRADSKILPCLLFFFFLSPGSYMQWIKIKWFCIFPLKNCCGQIVLSLILPSDT